MAWSSYQNKIFEYAVNPDNGSFVVSAVAGSGKTVTSVECAKRIAASSPEKKILFLAFNKSIVEELQSRVEGLDNIRCATLHSYGFSTLRRSKMKFNVNEKKWINYIRNNVYKLLDEPLEEKKIYPYIKNCESLMHLCRLNHVGGGSAVDVELIANYYGLNLLSNEAFAVANLLKRSANLFMFKTAKGIEIDYTDMLVLPLTDAFRQHIIKYDVVFIDEAQDLSAIQQELMLQTLKPDGKFISVGDPAQAINGFAGSLCDSFSKLVEKANGVVLPLSVNYRCGKNIITEAQKIVKEIEAYEDAEDGEILHQKHLKDVGAGDMVICRKTIPLIKTTLRLNAIGKSAYIKGRDIMNTLKDLIMKVGGVDDDNNLSLDSMFMKLDSHLNDVASNLIDKNIKNVKRHPVYIAEEEKVEAIKIIAENCYGPADVIALLDKIFDDQVRGDAIMLSTVHKAKGLENDNVFIIAPELLPMQYPGQKDWEYQQEMNLLYVAITRAKKRLVYVDVDENNIDLLTLE